MTYTQAAVERAMKVHEVLMQALNGRQPWIQVAEVLGVSARTVRRLLWRYERDGFTGLYDHRHHTPSPRAVPLAEVQRILQLYRDRYGPRDGHPGFNVRHFYERARREHGVTVSYSFVKKALQAAHLVGKRRPRGRHRRRREPRPCFGELLHLDGSRHRSLALVPGSSPPARAPRARATGTRQGRRVNEPRVAGIRTLPAANRYLREHFTPAYNATFGRPPADPHSAFVPILRHDLTQILCHEEERVVARDNTVTLERVVLQLDKQRGRRTCAGLRVLVRRHLDRQHSVWWGPRCLGRFSATGRSLRTAAA